MARFRLSAFPNTPIILPTILLITTGALQRVRQTHQRMYSNIMFDIVFFPEVTLFQRPSQRLVLVRTRISNVHSYASLCTCGMYAVCASYRGQWRRIPGCSPGTGFLAPPPYSLPVQPITPRRVHGHETAPCAAKPENSKGSWKRLSENLPTRKNYGRM